MAEKYYCPKSCELQGEKCPWHTKPELSSEPEDANYLNYCPFFLRELKIMIGNDKLTQ